MDVDADRFREAKEKAHAIYIAQPSLWCPYFKTQIVLNSDGFHHLQFSARRERNKREKLLKFRLLPLALRIIRDSGTVQEYRKLLTPVGKPSARGSVAMKEIEYWGLIGIDCGREAYQSPGCPAPCWHRQYHFLERHALFKN